MLTVSDSAMSSSLMSSSATVVTTGGGGGGLRLVLDFDFVPVEDFPETAPTMSTGVLLTVKDDED